MKIKDFNDVKNEDFCEILDRIVVIKASNFMESSKELHSQRSPLYTIECFALFYVCADADDEYDCAFIIFVQTKYLLFNSINIASDKIFKNEFFNLHTSFISHHFEVK